MEAQESTRRSSEVANNIENESTVNEAAGRRHLDGTRSPVSDD